MHTYRRVAMNIALIVGGFVLGILVIGTGRRPPVCFQPLSILPRILLGNLGASLALFLLGEYRPAQLVAAFLLGIASSGMLYLPALLLLLIHGPFELLGVSFMAEAGYRFWRDQDYMPFLVAGAGLIVLAAFLESFVTTWALRALDLCTP